MTLDRVENKGSQGESELKDKTSWEEEQGIIDALERYLSFRCPPPHPLMQWVMW